MFSRVKYGMELARYVVPSSQLAFFPYLPYLIASQLYKISGGGRQYDFH